MARIFNFSAGPAILPEPVLREAQEALWDFQGTGIGVMECSHRTKVYETVVDSAKERLKRLFGVGDDYDVLFMAGGASSQFFTVPANLLRGGEAAYLETGHWAEKAIKEAKRYGKVNVVWSSRESNFDHVPRPAEFTVPEGATYLHYTSNNTIYGTQFDYIPDANGKLLICDASSDVLSRPIDGTKFDILYAGAQKNLGPSGVVVVLIRKSILEKCNPDLPTMLRYGVHAENGSMYNTPNTWGIYIIERVCAWIEAQGGMAAIGAHNRAQAASVYTAIDESGGFWRGTCAADSRSWMNLTFTTGREDLDTTFHKTAEKNGLSGLKGHRAVGGLRASLYNAQTDEAVNALTAYMAEFAKQNG